MIETVGTTKKSIFLSPRIDAGVHFEVETTNGKVENKHTIYARGAPVAQYTTKSDGTNETVYYHKDHLGSIVAISNSSGAAIAKYWYDAWGSRIGLLGATKTVVNTYINDYTHHGFTGHQQVDDYGLIHMNGRIYDPVIGRFQTADPNVFYPESTQGFNRYSYVDNNPLSYTDPDGFQKVWDSAANFVADEVVNFGDSMAEHPKITGVAIAAVGAVLVWTGVGSYYGYVLISYGADFYQKDAIAADPHPVASIDFSLGGSGGGSSSSSSNGTGGSGSVGGGGSSDGAADATQEQREATARQVAEYGPYGYKHRIRYGLDISADKAYLYADGMLADSGQIMSDVPPASYDVVYPPSAGERPDATTHDGAQCLANCLGRSLTVTGAKEGGHSPGSAHGDGKAIDIGKNSNPGLDLQDIQRCFAQCFDRESSFGQEEGNHYHFQTRPGRGGATGFAQGVR